MSELAAARQRLEAAIERLELALSRPGDAGWAIEREQLHALTGMLERDCELLREECAVLRREVAAADERAARLVEANTTAVRRLDRTIADLDEMED